MKVAKLLAGCVLGLGGAPFRSRSAGRLAVEAAKSGKGSVGSSARGVVDEVGKSESSRLPEDGSTLAGWEE